MLRTARVKVWTRHVFALSASFDTLNQHLLPPRLGWCQEFLTSVPGSWHLYVQWLLAVDQDITYQVLTMDTFDLSQLSSNDVTGNPRFKVHLYPEMGGLIRVQWEDERRCHDDDLSALGSGEIRCLGWIWGKITSLFVKTDVFFFLLNYVSVLYLFGNCVTFVPLLARGIMFSMKNVQDCKKGE